jgi:hypothetical protein
MNFRFAFSCSGGCVCACDAMALLLPKPVLSIWTIGQGSLGLHQRDRQSRNSVAWCKRSMSPQSINEWLKWLPKSTVSLLVHLVDASLMLLGDKVFGLILDGGDHLLNSILDRPDPPTPFAISLMHHILDWGATAILVVLTYICIGLLAVSAIDVHRQIITRWRDRK